MDEEDSSDTIRIVRIKDPSLIKRLAVEMRKMENRYEKNLISIKMRMENFVKWTKRNIHKEDFFIFAAFDGEKPVGYIIGRGFKPYESRERAGYVEELYVLKNWRKHGIGSMLLKKAEDEFRKLGFKEMYLDVYAKNTARFFYLKNKFEEFEVTMKKELV